MCAGMFISGRLIDRFAPRSKTAYAWLPAVALALAIPFFIGFVWAPGWPLALVFLAVPDVPQLLLSLARRSRWCRKKCSRTSACWPARCCCW